MPNTFFLCDTCDTGGSCFNNLRALFVDLNSTLVASDDSCEGELGLFTMFPLKCRRVRQVLLI